MKTTIKFNPNINCINCKNNILKSPDEPCKASKSTLNAVAHYMKEGDKNESGAQLLKDMFSKHEPMTYKTHSNDEDDSMKEALIKFQSLISGVGSMLAADCKNFLKSNKSPRS